DDHWSLQDGSEHCPAIFVTVAKDEVWLPRLYKREQVVDHALPKPTEKPRLTSGAGAKEAREVLLHPARVPINARSNRGEAASAQRRLRGRGCRDSDVVAPLC